LGRAPSTGAYSSTNGRPLDDFFQAAFGGSFLNHQWLIAACGCANDTMVIVTYDEFGGQWDHVTPPGQGGVEGPHDQWGPGTRIPTLVIAPYLRRNFVVDHTQYDTTSILATIEARFRWRPCPVATAR
jgi:phospholipase C